jgi:polyvinyl alcohol dehydrogenase (cytochrome)
LENRKYFLTVLKKGKIMKKFKVINNIAFYLFMGSFFGSLLAQGNSLWLSAGQNRNNTRDAATENKISPTNADQLSLKWAFTTGGDVSATPAVDGDYVYFPDWAGNIYKLDAETGAQVWAHQVKEFTGHNFIFSRATPLITGNQVIFGTQLGDPVGLVGATIISLDKDTGELLWKTEIDDHPWSIVTQSAVAYGNTIYVGVASQEELAAGIIPGYEPSFRGSLVALNKTTGAIEWKTYMAPGSGFTGCAVWGSTPVIDPIRGSVYVATGNNYSVPDGVLDCVAAGGPPEDVKACIESVTGSSDNHFDAVVAMDLNTGAIKWANSVIPFDAWTTACFFNPPNCPDPAGPDYDFGQGPALFTTDLNGQATELLGAGQKSGIYWALNPDNGSVVWSTQASPGGVMGGLQWGSATDGERIYTAASNSYFMEHVMGPGPRYTQTITGGFWSALDAGTGQVVWENAGTTLAFPTLLGSPPLGAIAMNQGAVTVANGVMYAGALDQEGTMYAFNAATGDILWSFASGGSVNSGAAVVNGVVYWGSGYTALGGTPGTHLYAFAVTSSFNKNGTKTTTTIANPKQYVLSQNYPNPFNPTTKIRFSIPEASSVSLKIYDNTGQLIKTLVNGNLEAGDHSFQWDAKNDNGQEVSAGVYLYRITAGNYIDTKQMILMK